MKFIHNVRNYVSQHNLIKQSDKILIGISGGADSVALLILLNTLKYEYGFQLHIAHYNHQLRPSANRDESFVVDLAQSLNIPCHLGQSTRLKHKSKGSIEELARLERLDFFQTVRKEYYFNKLALAHNKDDLAETILMHILRGSGLKGMCGIQPITNINTTTIIRPLLNSTKEEIIQFLDSKQISFKTDPTNKDLQYFRNKIRLKLLPEIKKKYSPQITDLLSHLSASLSHDYDYIDKQSQKAFKRICLKNSSKSKILLDTAQFCRLHPSIQRMVLRHIYKELNNNLNKLTLKHIITVEEFIRNSSTSGQLNWPNGIIAKKSKSHVQFLIDNNA